MTQRLRSWERCDDVLLFRMFRYLKKYPDIGIPYGVAGEDDFDHVAVVMLVDADHGKLGMDVKLR